MLIITAIFAPFIATHDTVMQQYDRCVTPRLRPSIGSERMSSGAMFFRGSFSARGFRLKSESSSLSFLRFIGIIIGAIAGFYGGMVDKFLSGYLFNVFLAFPGLLLAIALVAFLGAGLEKLILALCVIGWVGYARVMRGQVLKVREYDFVQAARALGASNMRILFTHILPNAIQPLIVQASLGMAGAVLSEASLSFLGLGIPPPAPSWGTMIEEARGLDTLSDSPHVFFFPAIAIALTVLAFNFIGDGLREYLDPKQRKR